MKSNILKILGVLLVLSLMLMAIPTPVSAADLSVTIDAPDSAFVCETFDVTVTATATDDCFDDVTLSISVSGGAEVVGDSSQWVGDVCDGKSKSATFTVKCIDDVTATIDAAATSGSGGCATTLDTAQATVTQTCKLGVSITEPQDGTSFEISDTFAVTAEVTNNTDETCETANVCLAIDGNAELVPSDGACFDVGPIPAGDTQEVNWTVHCTDEGDVYLTVTATGCGQDECADACAATITIHQPEVPTCGLDLVITSDPQGEFCAGSTFTVTGYVENTGSTTLTDVDAILTATGDYASYVSISASGWYDVTSSLAPSGTAAVSWDVTCTGRDETTGQECLDQVVSFDADARATCETTNDTTDHEDLDDWANQKYVIVTITSPSTCTDICEGDEIDVTATIENCLTGDVGGTVEIWPDGIPSNVDLVNDEHKVQSMTIDGSSTDDVPIAWHIKCTGPGDVDIVVKFLGISPPGGPGTTACDIATNTIHQKTPADIGVTVDAPDCQQYCDEFDVTATVTNEGGADAAPISNVDVSMSKSGDVTLGTKSGPTGDTDEDGLLDYGEFWVYTWTGCECTGPADATFTAEASGTDSVCGGSLSASDSDTTEQIKLDVSITSPDECSTYHCSDTFCVTAEVSDNDDDTDFTGLAAVITFPNGLAELEAGETASKSFDLTDGDTQQISWTVHCNGPGATDIKVEVTGQGGGCTLFDKDDSITVYQEQPGVMVEILSPSGVDAELQQSEDEQGNPTATAEWSDFRAYTGKYSAKLTATGNNWAAVSFAPPAGITLDDMADITADSGWSWWYYIATEDFGYRGTQLELRFKGPGEGYAEMTIMDQAYGNPTLDAWTELTIVSDTTTGIVFGTTEDGTDFTQFPTDHEDTIANLVTHVTNQDVNAGDWVLVEVRPGLGWIGDAETTAYLDTVTIAGTTYDLEQFLSTYIATSQEFAVTAKVTNAGTTIAYDIPVTVSGNLFEVLSPAATQTISRLDPGESEILTWTLHCTDSGPSTITVTAVGATEAKAIVNIQQYPAAHPVVEITSVTPATTINVCDMFEVHYRVTNTGEADAWEVSAVLSVFPEGSVRIQEGHGGYSQFIGTLAGHGEDGYYDGIFYLHCKQACESTITITAEGFDEYGWHLKQDPQTGETILVDMPGRAIDERFIEPDSVTVKQLESEADLAVTKVVDATEPVVMGGEVTFTVTVENLGPSDATSIWVYDMLPSGLNYVSSTPGQGYYYVSSGDWDVGDLVEDATATLTIVATVNTVGEIENMAVIDYADQHDPVTGNNAATATVEGLEAEPATDWTIELDEGWNLISLPLIPTDPDIAAIMVGLTGTLDKVSQYVNDGDPTADDWKNYNPSAPSDLEEMADGWGYWVNMDTAGSLYITGWELVAETDPPSLPPSYDVLERWNMIGFKSTTPKLAEEYLAGIAGKYTMVYGFQDGVFFAVGSPGHEYLQPELGYWLAVKIGEFGTIFP